MLILVQVERRFYLLRIERRFSECLFSNFFATSDRHLRADLSAALKVFYAQHFRFYFILFFPQAFPSFSADTKIIFLFIFIYSSKRRRKDIFIAFCVSRFVRVCTGRSASSSLFCVCLHFSFEGKRRKGLRRVRLEGKYWRKKRVAVSTRAIKLN